MIEDYLVHRESLQIVFVLIDSRLDPQKIDLEFITWLGENGVPFALVFTKADKQSVNKGQQNMAKFKRVMKKDWAELPPFFLTSSETGLGKEQLTSYIQSLLEN
jgi:GTP-binding protein